MLLLYLILIDRICKDRNILKQYLSSKEVEVVTIMMSLFDDEQIYKNRRAGFRGTEYKYKYFSIGIKAKKATNMQCLSFIISQWR